MRFGSVVYRFGHETLHGDIQISRFVSKNRHGLAVTPTVSQNRLFVFRNSPYVATAMMFLDEAIHLDIDVLWE